MSDLPLPSAPRAVQAGVVPPLTEQHEPLRYGLRREVAIFLLLVATFGAVLFQDAIVARRFAIGPANIAGFSRYWYADSSSGGKSTAGGDAGSLRWTCDLRAGSPYPSCGSGILFDINHNGGGRDFSRFDKIVVDLDYQGPSQQLKVSLKNSDSRYTDPKAPDSTKPNALTFPVVPGRNRVQLDIANFAVEPWWADLHKAVADAGKPQFDNVVAVDIQTADGAKLGHYDFRLREVAASGASITPEHWYLILLGVWAGVAALYLVYRVVRMKRAFTLRHQHLVSESRLHAQARGAAESANEAKSRFLAHMSHELRTPLNAILGYAQLLKTSALDDRQTNAANTIQQSGEHLLSLITDILDISRIEAGKLDILPHPVEVRTMIRTVTDMMAVRAQQKGIVFLWTVAPDVPRGVVGDDKCLRQVLINLLGNAVKFTDRGEVRLIVAPVEATDGNVRLRFDVRDTGPGIAPDQLRTVFEPFEQVGDPSRRAGGTGLGLSISRRIVELMGGELCVESTPGLGSRFWFELTLPLADNKALPKAAEASPEPVATRPQRDRIDILPSAASMDLLHRSARAGNMRAIRVEADRLLREEPQARPFAEELLELARGYQSRVLLELIENHKQEA